MAFETKGAFSGVIGIKTTDPRSHGSWCIKEAYESTLVTDSSVPLMYHYPSDPDPDHSKGTHPKFSRMTDNDLHVKLNYRLIDHTLICIY